MRRHLKKIFKKIRGIFTIFGRVLGKYHYGCIYNFRYNRRRSRETGGGHGGEVMYDKKYAMDSDYREYTHYRYYSTV